MDRETDFPIQYPLDFGVQEVDKLKKLAELTAILERTKETLARKETMLSELERAVYSMRGSISRQQDAINRLKY